MSTSGEVKVVSILKRKLGRCERQNSLVVTAEEQGSGNYGVKSTIATL